MSTKIQELPERRVLVVDDDDGVLRTVTDMITGAGYKVSLARSGREALQSIEANTIHACLCDIMMPELDGIEFLSILRSRGVTVPFVFFTGFSNKQTISKALSLGVYEVIEKPFEEKELMTVLDRAIDMGVRLGEVRRILNALKSDSKISVVEVENLDRHLHQISLLNAVRVFKFNR